MTLPRKLTSEDERFIFDALIEKDIKRGQKVYKKLWPFFIASSISKKTFKARHSALAGSSAKEHLSLFVTK